MLKEASAQIEPLKADRDVLWAELDAVLKEMEPFKAREREIREKIKTIQNTLYPIEMAQSARLKK